MKPLHYFLHLEPNLENFICPGSTRIKIHSEEKLSTIVLNAKNLTILSCKINAIGEYMDCSFEINKDKEELVVNYPPGIQGEFELKIEFKAEINDKLEGLYRSRYFVEGQKEPKYIATTQFEEKFARRAFPCFDAPKYKTPFDIEYVIDENLIGISNTLISEEIKLEGGKKLVKFEQTPKMCTYLLYFGIGEFDLLEDTTSKPIIRVYTAPGKSEYGQLGLKISKKSLKHLEDLTGIAYPISKMDNIAVMDFEHGAMENYGAIVYRLTDLLYYPGKTSQAAKKRLVSVINHENAHQWFGNLVSPEDWQYVWLNESFATFFENYVTNLMFPEWHVWDNFIRETAMPALNRDSLINTLPIELPSGGKAEMSMAVVDIIYNKGAAIIRMLRDYLGEDKFKKGVQYFLNKYKSEVANTEQYWLAFQEGTGEPIKEFADCWVHQKGCPLVTAMKQGNLLKLSQSRFTFLPNEDITTWLIPITYTLYLNDGSQITKKIILDKPSMEISLPENIVAYKLNTKQIGYYRVRYTDENLQNLGKLIVNKKLDHMDIFGIQNDLYNLMKAGFLSIDNFLSFIEQYYMKEENALALQSISNELINLHYYLDSRRNKIEEIGRKIIEYNLNRIGLEPKEGDSLEISQLRTSLLTAGFLFKSSSCNDFMRQQYDLFKKGESIHADLLSTVYMGIPIIDRNSKEMLLKKFSDPSTTGIEYMYLCIALGMFQEKEDLEEMLEFALEKLPMSMCWFPITAATQNLAAKPWLWEWYKNHEKIMREKITPFDFGRMIISVIARVGPTWEEDVGITLEKINEELPEREEDIKMALELMKVYSTLISKN
jgi:aminopeptidase N